MFRQLLSQVKGKIYYLTGKKFRKLEKKIETFTIDEFQEFNQFLGEIESA